MAAQLNENQAMVVKGLKAEIEDREKAIEAVLLDKKAVIKEFDAVVKEHRAAIKRLNNVIEEFTGPDDEEEAEVDDPTQAEPIGDSE